MFIFFFSFLNLFSEKYDEKTLKEGYKFERKISKHPEIRAD